MAINRKALSELTKKMRAVGLPEPAAAAREELETGAPILATYSFLKWLTDEIVPSGDYEWMKKARNRDEALGDALQRMLDAGADRDDLNTVVRAMQYRICEHVCFMLDQVALPGQVPIQDFAVYHVGGGDSPEEDKPLARLEGLHEEIEAWDPSQPEE